MPNTPGSDISPEVFQQTYVIAEVLKNAYSQLVASWGQMCSDNMTTPILLKIIIQ